MSNLNDNILLEDFLDSLNADDAIQKDSDVGVEPKYLFGLTNYMLSQRQMKESDTDFIRTYAMTLKASETVFNFISNVHVSAVIVWEVDLNKYEKRLLHDNATVDELKT